MTDLRDRDPRRRRRARRRRGGAGRAAGRPARRADRGVSTGSAGSSPARPCRRTSTPGSSSSASRASYRALRDGIRDYYRAPLPADRARAGVARAQPGRRAASAGCATSRGSRVAVIEAMLAPYRGGGRLTVLQPYRPVAAETDGDRVTRGDACEHRDGGERLTLAAPYVLDATETGDLLPLTGTEYVTGFESQAETGEPSAPDEAQPDNMQAVSVCFAIDHVDGDHTIDRPADYDFWRAYQPPFWGGTAARLRGADPRTLETSRAQLHPEPRRRPAARSIADQRVDPRRRQPVDVPPHRRPRATSSPGAYASDICLVNWPMIDYFEGPVIDVPDAATARSPRRGELSPLGPLLAADRGAARRRRHRVPRPAAARRRHRHAPTAWRRRPTSASRRRIRAEYTVVEQDLSLRGARRQGRGRATATASASACTASTCTRRPAATTTSTSARCPFEIPLGALIPRRVENLLPAGKNIGTTHITNGCYRLHPVEWNVGEVAGALAAFCLDHAATPRAVRNDARPARRLPGPARPATASSCAGPTSPATEPTDESARDPMRRRSRRRAVGSALALTACGGGDDAGRDTGPVVAAHDGLDRERGAPRALQRDRRRVQGRRTRTSPRSRSTRCRSRATPRRSPRRSPAATRPTWPGSWRPRRPTSSPPARWCRSTATLEATPGYNLADLTPSAPKLWQPDGELYAYPFSTSPFGVFVNNDLLKAGRPADAGRADRRRTSGPGTTRIAVAAAVNAKHRQGRPRRPRLRLQGVGQPRHGLERLGRRSPGAPTARPAASTEQPMVDAMTFVHKAIFTDKAMPGPGTDAPTSSPATRP